jgi:hypothetical protein
MKLKLLFKNRLTGSRMLSASPPGLVESGSCAVFAKNCTLPLSWIAWYISASDSPKITWYGTWEGCAWYAALMSGWEEECTTK